LEGWLKAVFVDVVTDADATEVMMTIDVMGGSAFYRLELRQEGRTSLCLSMMEKSKLLSRC